EDAVRFLDSLTAIDPLNHFAYFERYLWDGTDANKKAFTGLIQNEMPAQTYLELAAWYYNAGLSNEAAKVLEMVGPPPSPSATPPPAGDNRLSSDAAVLPAVHKEPGNISPVGGGRKEAGNVSPAGGGGAERRGWTTPAEIIY